MNYKDYFKRLEENQEYIEKKYKFILDISDGIFRLWMWLRRLKW